MVGEIVFRCCDERGQRSAFEATTFPVRLHMVCSQFCEMCTAMYMNIATRFRQLMLIMILVEFVPLRSLIYHWF